MNRKLTLTALPLLLSTALVAAVTPFANTNAASQLWVCATEQESVLNGAAYAALAWVQVGGVGEVGQIGTQQNVLTYDTWADSVIQKAKGMKNAGDPVVEVARKSTDAGQVILRNAAKTNFNYAFKIIRNDKLTSGGTGTIIYNRGLVTGPVRPQGRNEDFDLEQFTLGFQQEEIIVEPT